MQILFKEKVMRTNAYNWYSGLLVCAFMLTIIELFLFLFLIGSNGLILYFNAIIHAIFACLGISAKIRIGESFDMVVWKQTNGALVLEIYDRKEPKSIQNPFALDYFCMGFGEERATAILYIVKDNKCCLIFKENLLAKPTWVMKNKNESSIAYDGYEFEYIKYTPLKRKQALIIKLKHILLGTN